MFKPVSPNQNFPDLEEKVLTDWDQNQTFAKSLERRKGAQRFIFYDGPPFATGLPHYGHLLAGIIKDIIPRYWTMQGYSVDRRFGWDCHGLPVEYEMEKELNLNGKKQIETYGVDQFNEACRGTVLRYTKEWRKTVRRIGRWVDFDNDYKTMNPEFMESVWWVFKQLFDKKMIYEGYKVQPYCPRCSTPLSNFETNLGYKDRQDPSITIKLKGNSSKIDQVYGKKHSGKSTYFLVWTTTPWTLPSNLALAVNPKIDYVKVWDKGQDEFYFLAEARLNAYYKSASDYEIVSHYTGKQLVGDTYDPVFEFFKGRSDYLFKVGAADFVSTEEGTGIVHIAPAFGEEDFEVGKRMALPIINPIDEEGKFTAEVPPYAGMEVKTADTRIIQDLKNKGVLVQRSTLQHSYPHCYRCDTPLIYKAIATWFLDIAQIKDGMMANNKTVHWIPEHIQGGRFGKWLENARDWNLSRNRYWGTPIPVWKCECGEKTCIGSVRELEIRSGEKIKDLHKHFIDPIRIPCPVCSKPMQRVPEILDCWFESGSMPFAQNHFPFKQGFKLEDNFPADFIAEGLDQTRGWFYTLMVMGTALYQKAAYKNVIVNGIILSEEGKKLSKRLKNYPDPENILQKYGADALRIYLINSPAVRGEDLKFSEKGIEEVLRAVLLPLWNAYSFFVTYANIDGWQPRSEKPVSSHELDQWILSRMQSLISGVTLQMSEYRLDKVVPELVLFIDQLTNWYIRRSRRRFWKTENDGDKKAAYQTLHTVLVSFARVLAPFLPFISETIYQNLTKHSGVEQSVHLTAYPISDQSLLRPEIEERMDLVRLVVGLGRSLRTKHELKIRQPLKKIIIVTRETRKWNILKTMEDLMKDELNVKSIDYTDKEESLVDLSAKPNFKKLGQRFGKEIQSVAAFIRTLNIEAIRKMENGGTVIHQGQAVGISDILIERKEKGGHLVNTENGVTVALVTALDESLIREGLAREFVNKVQHMRKTKQLEVLDRIAIQVVTEPAVRDAIVSFIDYVKTETLARDLKFVEKINGQGEDWDLNDHPARILIQKQ